MPIATLTADDLREPGRENTQLTKLNELVTKANALDAGSVAKFVSVGPVAAKDADIIHGAVADGDAAAFPGPFGEGEPDVPRNLRVTYGTGWLGGAVTVVGTNQFDEAISEEFEAGDNEIIVGTKIFKTVVSASKALTEEAGIVEATIGTGDLLGLPMALADDVGMGFVAAVAEVITLDADVHAFTPDTTPADTTYTVLANFALTE